MLKKLRESTSSVQSVQSDDILYSLYPSEFQKLSTKIFSNYPSQLQTVHPFIPPSPSIAEVPLEKSSFSTGCIDGNFQLIGNTELHRGFLRNRKK